MSPDSLGDVTWGYPSQADTGRKGSIPPMLAAPCPFPKANLKQYSMTGSVSGFQNACRLKKVGDCWISGREKDTFPATRHWYLKVKEMWMASNQVVSCSKYILNSLQGDCTGGKMQESSAESCMFSGEWTHLLEKIISELDYLRENGEVLCIGKDEVHTAILIRFSSYCCHLVFSPIFQHSHIYSTGK